MSHVKQDYTSLERAAQGSTFEKFPAACYGWNMPPPCNPLNMPLWALPGLSLYVACSERGHNTVMYPIKLLAARHGHHHRLRELLPRFKCQQCGQPPAKALLCEKPYTDDAGMAGFNPGWKVDLMREVIFAAACAAAIRRSPDKKKAVTGAAEVLGSMLGVRPET